MVTNIHNARRAISATGLTRCAKPHRMLDPARGRPIAAPPVKWHASATAYKDTAGGALLTFSAECRAGGQNAGVTRSVFRFALSVFAAPTVKQIGGIEAEPCFLKTVLRLVWCNAASGAF